MCSPATDSDQPRPLVPAMFTGVLSRLRRTHNVILVDTSDDLEHPVMKAVLDVRHSRVRIRSDRRHLAAGHPVDRPASLDGLPRIGVAQHGDPQRQSEHLRPRYGGYLTERFSQTGATVEYMPYDPHLAKGGIIDTRNELRSKMRLRLFEITAALADKYVPDADRPR